MSSAIPNPNIYPNFVWRVRTHTHTIETLKHIRHHGETFAMHFDICLVQKTNQEQWHNQEVEWKTQVIRKNLYCFSRIDHSILWHRAQDLRCCHIMSVCVYFHILCIGYISKTPDLPKRQDLALVPELSFPFRCLKLSFCPCWHSWLSIFRVRKDGFADDAFAFAEHYVDFF
jgi:hypothetical protein